MEWERELRDPLEEGRRCRRGSWIDRSWDGSEEDEGIRTTTKERLRREGWEIEEELVPIVVAGEVVRTSRRVLRLERLHLALSFLLHLLKALPPATEHLSPSQFPSRSPVEVRILIRQVAAGEEVPMLGRSCRVEVARARVILR